MAARAAIDRELQVEVVSPTGGGERWLGVVALVGGAAPGLRRLRSAGAVRRDLASYRAQTSVNRMAPDPSYSEETSPRSVHRRDRLDDRDPEVGCGASRGAMAVVQCGRRSRRLCATSHATIASRFGGRAGLWAIDDHHLDGRRSSPTGARERAARREPSGSRAPVSMRRGRTRRSRCGVERARGTGATRCCARTRCCTTA